MIGRACKIVALMAVIAMACPAVAEDDPSRWSIGARAAVSANRTDDEVFHLYEAIVGYALPYRFQMASVWALHTGLSAHAGLIAAGGDNGLIVAVGPTAGLDLPGGIFYVAAGVRAGLMSRHTYGKADLGGAFTFEADLGLGLNLGRRLSAGYRWQHLSNARVYAQNPSVNLHALDLTYRF